MQPNTFFALEQVIDRQPLTVAPETPLTKVIRLMQEWGNSCTTSKNNSDTDTTDRSNNSCVLVVENARLLGIFTERDLVGLIAAGVDTQNATVGDTMTENVVSLTFDESQDIFAALKLLRQHSIRHLPIVEDRHNLIGLVTAKNLRQKLQPINLMKWRRVAEVMQTGIIHADPDDSVRQVAWLMAQHKISCVAIAESKPDPETNRSFVHPVGIITERDIVQYQNLDLDLEQPAKYLMSAPLFLIDPDASLWSVQQQMQQRRVRRLLVGDAKGELRGIITQTTLLQVFDPAEMFGAIEMLQRQVCSLEVEKTQLLESRQTELEREVRERTATLKLTNRQLREAHQQLFFHVNNSPLAVVEWDSNFCVKRWSERAEQMFGWQKSEVMGKHWREWQFVLSEDSDSVVGINERLLNGTEPRNISHNRNYTKEGSVIDCEWYNSVLLDESGNLVSILSLVQDVSDRENARRERWKTKVELQERVRQQRAVAELGQFALKAKSLDIILNRAVDLVATTLEVEYCKVLQMLPDSQTLLLKAGVGWQDGLVGTTTLDTAEDSQAGYTLRHLEPVIVKDLADETRFTGSPLLLDRQVISCMSVIIQDDGQPFGVLGAYTAQHRTFSQNDANFLETIANIIAQTNERLIAESSLRASEQKFDSILGSLNDIVWSADARTFKLIYINQAAEKIYGRQVAEFYRHDNLWLEMVHPEDRDRVSKLPSITTEQGSCEMEYRIVRPDGEIRWLLDRANLACDEDNKPRRFDGNSTDITQRKQAESEILKFVSLADNSSDFIGMCDLNFVPFYINEAGKQLVGLNSLKQYREVSVGDFFFSEDRDFILQEFFPRVLREGHGEVEIRFRHFQTGEAIWMIYNVHLIEDENGRSIALATLSRDISDRKRREEILEDIASGISTEVGENFFHSLTKYLSKTLQVDFAFICELVNPERDSLQTLAVYGKGETLENFVSQIANAPCGEVIGRGLCVYSESVRQLFPNVPPLEAMAAESYGGMPIFNTAGEVIGLIGIVDTKPFADIPLIEEVLKIFATRATAELERQQAENKIKQQAALLDVTTDAIMVRGLDNQLLFWNQGAEKLYGWTQAEALAADVSTLLYRKSSARLDEIQQAVKETGEWQGELKQVTKAGKEIIVESRWTLVKDETGNPKSYLIVNTNITEQKQLEAQFLRTQRLESLGTLAGGIAHDLNNILAPILGFAKLLPLKLADVDEQTKDFFKIMETNAERGTALVKQILTFSRGLEGERGIVQIRHLINEIGQIITETFPKSIELKIDAPKTLWTVNADVNQLHQVLMNLCVNARDAMPDGGKLTIAAENTVVEADYVRLHLEATEGSYVLISVTDTGVGIPPEIIDRIFEPFFTTKEIGRGTGLGLSTVIGIVKSHDGFVDVVSKTTENRGTKVNIFIPASNTAANATEEEESIPQGNGELILVVDDETPMLQVTKATLETYNYRVLTASDGIEAVATYAKDKDEIALVITDIMMPSMDGKTAIRTLKQINPELDIIAMSGLISSKEIITELDDDVTAFMSKPCNNDDLLRKIAEIVSTSVR